MKTIPLSQGKFALVDDEDFEELNQHRWFAARDYRTFYARRWTPRVNGKRKQVAMHQVLMQTNGIDHKDGNGLNNQRSNLRPATPSQNRANQVELLKENTSGYRGVSWNNKSNKWQAQIRTNHRGYWLGVYTDKRLAALAYNSAALKIFGEYARVNVIGWPVKLGVAS